MRNRHVKQSIPSLLSEIRAKLALCNNDISKLGPPCDTNFQQFTLINGIATKYSRMAENSLNGNYRGLNKSDMFARKLIRDGLDKFCTTLQAEGPVKPFVTCTAEAKLILTDDGMTWSEKLMKDPTYGWIRQVIGSFRGTEFPGDLNPLVVDFLWRKQTTGWRAIAEDALAEAESIVERVNEALFQIVCSDDDLRVNLRDWLHADFQKASVDAAKELEPAVLNTHDSLEAYYELARWRFTDNAATQVIERHQLGPDGPLRLFSPQYVSEKLYGEQNEDALSNLVGENPNKAQKRLGLDSERRSLEESMKRLQAFKML
ncbi:putative dynamin family protein [Botrytis fragariae]|uniref:Putative dynamin family protein n=1 Tax=Botrytis fragariae TaxID=1964551 RepID=A0A8H6EM88_9HELO|nr:putative dynamin family protein [Botrytis fragariae]KAF5877427.1 putative dynamin family protein [Botrytis fragariae]